MEERTSGVNTIISTILQRIQKNAENFPLSNKDPPASVKLSFSISMAFQGVSVKLIVFTEQRVNAITVLFYPSQCHFQK